MHYSTVQRISWAKERKSTLRRQVKDDDMAVSLMDDSDGPLAELIVLLTSISRRTRKAFRKTGEINSRGRSNQLSGRGKMHSTARVHYCKHSAFWRAFEMKSLSKISVTTTIDHF